MRFHPGFISILAMIAVCFIVLPLIVDLGSSTMNILILLFVYIILSQSWNLLGGYTGQINLGFAAYFGCGVLLTHLLWKSGVPIYFAIAVGGLSAALLAGVIGLPTLHLRGAYFAIGTVALAEALRIVVGNVFPSSLSLPGTFASNFNVFPRYYLGFGIAVLAMISAYLLVKSKFGLAMVCVRDDEEAAQVTGINTFKTKFIALLISAFFAGLAGGVYSFNRFYFHHVSAVFEPVWTFEPLMAVVIGGSGTLIGPIIGSIFLIVLSEIFVQTLGEAHLIIFGVLLIPVVLYSPSGLVGWIGWLRKSLGGVTMNHEQ
ncbi:MAG TPA: branched-chain amino acid ABC transporter permease [Thermodesulfobacteriota bacterium]|nr:branched-chain amino acid ABC transporter permease [Thermodesulfobacteriota bacterium]